MSSGSLSASADVFGFWNGERKIEIRESVGLGICIVDLTRAKTRGME